MEPHEFDHYVRHDPPLDAFVRTVATEAAQELTLNEPQRFMTVTGTDLLMGLAAYALCRWAKDYFDQRRALVETDIAKQQTQLINDLVPAGFPPKDA
jgi:hypothetical protein